jgi:hypothetical protein
MPSGMSEGYHNGHGRLSFANGNDHFHEKAAAVKCG